MPAPTLQLTRDERLLCMLLDDTCRWICATDPAIDLDGACRRFSEVCRRNDSGISLEARIAGGWVRDKLLHLPSHDLDVSLSTLTGHIFALFLKAYIESSSFQQSILAAELASAQGNTAVNMSHIGKIAANPEQSKNLETATARVLGYDLDFVNLRKEVYEGESRIPVMSFGTPLEDAQRRDMTVNALFYNVHSQQIEDWTQSGLDDMREGLVRTPMEPETTFTDDPLRILRCVRFASRFHYTIHKDIRACLCGVAHGDEAPDSAARKALELRDALQRKVSRERFGIEIDKMLTGNDPLYALRLLSELHLYRIVFSPPPPFSDKMLLSDDGVTPGAPASFPGEASALASGAFLDELLSGNSGAFADAIKRLPSDWLAALREPSAKARLRLVWFAVALMPLRNLYVNIRKGKVEFQAAQATIAVGLKLGSKNTKEPVGHLFDAAKLLSRPDLSRFTSTDPLMTLRSNIGLLLRNQSITNVAQDVDVSTALLTALLFDLPWNNGVLDSSADSILDEYATFWRYITDEHLAEQAHVKPILDGHQIVAALDCAKPLIRFIQPYVLAWQLDHDDMSLSLEERQKRCSDALKAAWDAGHMVPVEQRDRGSLDQMKKRRK